MENNEKVLKEIFINFLTTNISIMKFYKNLSKDQKSINVCNKSIRESKKAIEVVKNIKHIGILNSLYRSLLAGKEVIFTMCGPLLNRKETQYWDTEKGYVEFLNADKKAQEEYLEQARLKAEEREKIKQAQEQGKKIEFVYENGKVKPLIVDSGEKPN